MKKTVYVFFSEASHITWWMRFLKRKMSHCFSYEHQLLGGYDVFIKLENLYHVVDTTIFFGLFKDLLLRFPQYRIVQIKMEVNPLNKTFDFMPINCVSLIKKQLGINKPFILTPKQLYEHLLTIGGKEI